VLYSFLGEQELIPPMYSAIKVKGKKLYEYARQGKIVEVKPREIEIYKINLIKINEEQKQIEFQVHCSKGTYIRSLCEDIAKKLGTVRLHDSFKPNTSRKIFTKPSNDNRRIRKTRKKRIFSYYRRIISRKTSFRAYTQKIKSISKWREINF